MRSGFQVQLKSLPQNPTNPMNPINPRNPISLKIIDPNMTSKFIKKACRIRRHAYIDMVCFYNNPLSIYSSTIFISFVAIQYKHTGSGMVPS